MNIADITSIREFTFTIADTAQMSSFDTWGKHFLIDILFSCSPLAPEGASREGPTKNGRCQFFNDRGCGVDCVTCVGMWFVSERETAEKESTFFRRLLYEICSPLQISALEKRQISYFRYAVHGFQLYDWLRAFRLKLFTKNTQIVKLDSLLKNMKLLSLKEAQLYDFFVFCRKL